MTHEELVLWAHYDPNTGWFTAKKARGTRWKVGRRIGSVDKRKGYRRVKLADGSDHFEHRLAWFYVHGVWPSGQIDHLNGNTADNRIANLRDVTGGANQQNRRSPNKNNTAGLLGVTYSRGGRPTAGITIKGRRKYLGTFNTEQEAHEAYLKAKRTSHEGNLL